MQERGNDRNMAKTIEELTITDDFMFGAVMRDPKRCKPLLEIILGVKIKKITYPELQKVIDQRYDSKSIRLDVYVEGDENAVYNVEIQTTAKKNLPKRMRYYQGMLDINILEKGQDYTDLKKSFVIFICTYDPFGEEKYSYTFENRCADNHELLLGDEATKIVLNTKGTKGEASRELKQLLHFMDGMEPENDYTKELEKAVTQVKESEEWRREFMLMMERDRDNIKIGKLSEKIAAVREFSQEFEGEQLAKYARTKPETVSVILNLIDEHPEWDDERIAEEMLF